MPSVDQKKSDDLLIGRAAVDLYADEKNQLREMDEKKIIGSVFAGGDDDVTNVLPVYRAQI